MNWFARCSAFGNRPSAAPNPNLAPNLAGLKAGRTNDVKLIIGTRGSQLALWQANWVKGQLDTAGHQTEVRIIKTTGDKLENIPLTSSGTKGLFIKEIQEALLEGSVDLAVHSLKDLPTETTTGLTLGAVPRREDARDVLITSSGSSFSDLHGGEAHPGSYGPTSERPSF